MLRVIKTKRLGLEVYLITRDGKEIHSFVSVQHAITRFRQLAGR